MLTILCFDKRLDPLSESINLIFLMNPKGVG